MSSVFTKIINGDLPGHFVWKDEQAVAFMTIQPTRPGHVLVVPRAEVDHWNDLPPELVSHLFLVSQKISHGLKKAYPARRVGLMVAGLEVPHTHIHLVPLDSMVDLSLENLRSADATELAEAARRIRTELQALGYSEAQL